MTQTKLTKNVIKKYLTRRMLNQQNFYMHPSFTLERKLNDCITRGIAEEAKLVLDQINKLERAYLADNDIRSLKNSLICSCTLFTRAAIKGGAQAEDAFNLSDAFIQQIEQETLRDDLVNLEYEMVSSFIKKSLEGKRPNYNYVVNKAISFIHQHILDELSLNTIAGEIGVNPSYLSKLFKKTVGISLTNFISKRKIEESKHFLHHSQISVSEISQIFNFCNQSYYSALFKKYTGITPKQYKGRYAKQSDDIFDEENDDLAVIEEKL